MAILVENYRLEAEKWLVSERVDAHVKEQIRSMSEEELRECFGKYMVFGTAGLRAEMKPGSAKMNVYTVAHAAEGLSRLIEADGSGAADRGVVIAWDSRNNSYNFALRSAEVISSHGIKVYMFDGCRPTPVLSFAVRHLNCIAGINVTASHNPKEYNGYKVYWEDGAQLSPEHAAVVSESMEKTDIFSGVPTPDSAQRSLITVLGREIDDEYVKCVFAQMVNPDTIHEEADGLAVVYTPLHGAGGILVPRVLREAGLTRLFTVKEQMEPDGDFPTLKYPNPEFAEAFTLGIEEAQRRGSDLVVATDPDTDRVGAAARGKDGKFYLITGNQMGALLLDYIITELRSKGKMPDEPYAVKTIVTTPLAAEICRAGGVKMYDVLTGFKFIGEVIKEHEKSGSGTFILGFEESYGYLKGTYCRDKDAVVASLLICEMAAYYRKRSMTLIDALHGVFEKYGYYRENVFNIEMQGLSGSEKMKSLMQSLRSNPPSEIGGRRITEYRDYLSGEITDADTGEKKPTGLPVSDVMYFVTENGDKIIVRPSGTEPKIKVYVLTSGENEADAAGSAALCESGIREIIK